MKDAGQATSRMVGLSYDGLLFRFLRLALVSTESARRKAIHMARVLSSRSDKCCKWPCLL